MQSRTLAMTDTQEQVPAILNLHAGAPMRKACATKIAVRPKVRATKVVPTPRVFATKIRIDIRSQGHPDNRCEHAVDPPGVDRYSCHGLKKRSAGLPGARNKSEDMPQDA